MCEWGSAKMQHYFYFFSLGAHNSSLLLILCLFCGGARHCRPVVAWWRQKRIERVSSAGSVCRKRFSLTVGPRCTAPRAVCRRPAWRAKRWRLRLHLLPFWPMSQRASGRRHTGFLHHPSFPSLMRLRSLAEGGDTSSVRRKRGIASAGHGGVPSLCKGLYWLSKGQSCPHN